LLDISATGEENLIEAQSGNQMKDLEYRRKQLLKLQDAVIDLEDLSSGVSITDLTLTDFRIDLGEVLPATVCNCLQRRRDRADAPSPPDDVAAPCRRKADPLPRNNGASSRVAPGRRR